MSICMKCGDTHAKSCEQNIEQRRLIEQLRREADEADRERARFASTNVTLGSQVDAERTLADALMNALSYEGGPWPKKVGAAMQVIRDAREKSRTHG